MYKKLEFLKLNDLNKFELAKFMPKLYNNNLPQIFQTRFAKAYQVDSYKTRSVKKRTGNYFLPRVSKFFCQNSLIF